MRRFGWVAAAVLVAAGCEQREGESRTQDFVSSAQEQSEQAFEKAKEAQEKASEKQAELMGEQGDIQEAEQELREQRAEIDRARAEAEAAQREAREAGTEAQATAEAAQQRAEEGQRQMAQAEAEQRAQLAEEQRQEASATRQEAEAAATAPAGEVEVSGKVAEASSDRISIDAGGTRLELEVPPGTQVTVRGQVASVNELKPGDEVRASYRTEEGKTTASKIEATPAGEGSGSMQEPKTGAEAWP